MHRGYSLCSADLTQVVCLSSDKQTLFMVPIDSTQVLNSALCLHDLTEANNVLKRLIASEHENVVKETKICNIARLYKKFF